MNPYAQLLGVHRKALNNLVVWVQNESAPVRISRVYGIGGRATVRFQRYDLTFGSAPIASILRNAFSQPYLAGE